MPRKTYRSFKDARAFVRGLKFQSVAEYRKWVGGDRPDLEAKPADIPSNPHQAYRDEFKGYSDFIGTGIVATYRREWPEFAAAREFVRGLGLQSMAEFREYVKTQKSSGAVMMVPSNPNMVYSEDGWGGFRDWLGTGDTRLNRTSRLRSFKASRVFARSLGLASWVEWREYVSGKRTDMPTKPLDVPALPHAAYKGKGWKTYADFLGGDNRAWHSTEWRGFSEAREFARSLNLKTNQDWRRWFTENGPTDIPANPDKAYPEWVSWNNWLQIPFPKKRPRTSRSLSLQK